LNQTHAESDIITFEWTKAIETGREDIDQEHRKIIEYLNDLRKAVNDKNSGNMVSGIFLGLKEYIDIHFTHEEDLMSSFDYDERDMHLSQHAGFARRINAIKSDHFDNEDTAQALLLFAYDWLIKHIVGVDRIMIRKLSGDDLLSMDGDWSKQQTSLIIDGAYMTVALIESLMQEIARATTAAAKKKAQIRVADASTRLINLVTLASGRIRMENDSGDNRDRLNGLKSGLVSSTRILLEGKARKLIEYGARIIQQNTGTPFGCGVIVSTQMMNVFGMIDILGGVGALSASQQEAVAKAATIADAVRDMEAQTYKLPSFGGDHEASPHFFKMAYSKRAASQADVLKMAQEAQKASERK
jgi:hemerythrin-like metal-binding protein